MSSHISYRSHLLDRRGPSVPSYCPRNVSVHERERSILYSPIARSGVAVQATPPDLYRLGCIMIFACSKCRPRFYLILVLMWSSGQSTTHVGTLNLTATLL